MISIHPAFGRTVLSPPRVNRHASSAAMQPNPQFSGSPNPQDSQRGAISKKLVRALAASSVVLMSLFSPGKAQAVVNQDGSVCNAMPGGGSEIFNFKDGDLDEAQTPKVNSPQETPAVYNTALQTVYDLKHSPFFTPDARREIAAQLETMGLLNTCGLFKVVVVPDTDVDPNELAAQYSNELRKLPFRNDVTDRQPNMILVIVKNRLQTNLDRSVGFAVSEEYKAILDHIKEEEFGYNHHIYGLLRLANAAEQRGDTARVQDLRKLAVLRVIESTVGHLERDFKAQSDAKVKTAVGSYLALVGGSYWLYKRRKEKEEAAAKAQKEAVPKPKPEDNAPKDAIAEVEKEPAPTSKPDDDTPGDDGC